MERFYIEKCTKRDTRWFCFDRMYGTGYQFEHQRFNDTQIFGMKIGTILPEGITTGNLSVEMEDWLWEHHIDKLIPPINYAAYAYADDDDEDLDDDDEW